jgi:hypothetical protein
MQQRKLKYVYTDGVPSHFAPIPWKAELCGLKCDS